MTEKEKVDQENVNNFTETINDAGIIGDEGPGKVALGRYLCTCVESQPINRSTGEGGYNYLVANLKWRIDKAYEIGGIKVPENKQDAYSGFIFDDIRMQNKYEKEVWRKRRIWVAKLTGLINEASDKITKEMWAIGIIGKKAIITVEDRKYKDKQGNDKIASRVVAFSGYDYPPKKEVVADTFYDI